MIRAGMLGAEALFTPLDTQAFRVLSTIPQRQSVAGDFSVSLFYIGELRTNQCFMMLGALRTNRAGSGKLRTIRGRPARMTAGSGDVGLFWRRRPCGSRGCFLHCCSSLNRIFYVFHCTWCFSRNSPPCFSFRLKVSHQTHN